MKAKKLNIGVFDKGGRYKDFMLNVRISDRQYDQYFSPSEFEWREDTPQLIKDLFAINGVDSIALMGYGVRIEISEMFKWEKIEKSVKQLLESHFSNLIKLKEIEEEK